MGALKYIYVYIPATAEELNRAYGVWKLPAWNSDDWEAIYYVGLCNKETTCLLAICKHVRKTTDNSPSRASEFAAGTLMFDKQKRRFRGHQGIDISNHSQLPLL